MLSSGDLAPLDIKIMGPEGEQVSLRSFLGNYLVVYFYPKDDTPGCTMEACNFRDVNHEITKLGARIIGISKDTVKSHQKFMKKYNLNFTLLSDEGHKLMEAFGTWGKKKLFGVSYMGTSRSTFIINPEGRIIKVYEKAKPKEHAQEVFEFLGTVI